MSASQLSLEMQVLLGPVEYVDPPNAHILTSVMTPVACKKGMGKISTNAWEQEQTEAVSRLNSECSG